jgi:hypothetical protein
MQVQSVGLSAPENKEVTTVSDLKQAIANADDIESDVVHVPQWGVDIGVRSMDGNDRADLLENFSDEDGKMSFRKLYPELLILCTFDPSTGEPVFEDTDADRALILGKNAKALEVVARKAMEMSGLDEKAEERAGKS